MKDERGRERGGLEGREDKRDKGIKQTKGGVEKGIEKNLREKAKRGTEGMRVE